MSKRKYKAEKNEADGERLCYNGITMLRLCYNGIQCRPRIGLRGRLPIECFFSVEVSLLRKLNSDGQLRLLSDTWSTLTSKIHCAVERASIQLVKQAVVGITTRVNFASFQITSSIVDSEKAPHNNNLRCICNVQSLLQFLLINCRCTWWITGKSVT